MFQILNDDIFINISYFLDLTSILNLKNTTKIFICIFNEEFFKNLAMQEFGIKFWQKAKERPELISKPLKSYCGELIRIEKFQQKLEELGHFRWENKDFYKYWDFNLIAYTHKVNELKIAE